MKILKILFGWSVILIILLSSVRLCAFDTRFYHMFYEKIDLAQQLDVDQEALDQSMSMMLDYILDKKESMDGTIEIGGVEREVYNAKEKRHMVDVKALFQKAMAILYGSIVLALLIPLFFYWKTRDPDRVLALCCTGFLDSLFCFLILLAFIGIWIGTDFTDFWIHFHELFFDNDLWLLDPQTDFMIQICPESMFFALVLKIVSIDAALLIPLTIFSIYYIKKKARIGDGL